MIAPPQLLSLKSCRAVAERGVASQDLFRAHLVDLRVNLRVVHG